MFSRVSNLTGHSEEVKEGMHVLCVCKNVKCFLASAEEVMFSPVTFCLVLGWLVGLLVGLSAGLHKNYLKDYLKTWMEVGSWPRMDLDPCVFTCVCCIYEYNLMQIQIINWIQEI